MAEFIKSERNIRKLLAEKTYNLRELACINELSSIINLGKSIDETLQNIVYKIPESMENPQNFGATIIYDKQEYKSSDFKTVKVSIYSKFTAIDDTRGKVILYNLHEPGKEKVFGHEEERFLSSVSSLIAEYINSFRARQVLKFPDRKQAGATNDEHKRRKLSTQQLLQKFLDRHNSERNLFHELMPFKVKEVLLIANLYDAYIIEGEGRFSDHILGEYHQMNLTVMPRVTGVSSEKEALKRLGRRHFDIIIIMVGVDKQTPLKISERISRDYPYIPTYLLLNNNGDIAGLKEIQKENLLPSNLFVWNGDSKVFFAMLKLLEDLVNVDNDVRLGVTKVILLVEDNPIFYSKYLSILYSLVLEQTRELIEDVSKDDLYKVLKLRARPKIVLAKTYEEAVDVIRNLGDFLLCVISDVSFPRKGELSKTAGFDLIRHVRKKFENLPLVLQSSEPKNENKARELNVHFMNKNSETLLQDLRSFIKIHLGFGNFVYRDPEGKQIAVARSMEEFENYLRTIPEESLVYHAMKNQFSMWLMARGEFDIAKLIYPLRIQDFHNLNEMREVMIEILRERVRDRDRGKILQFNESAILDESNIVSMAAGSLGGKGRGLAFVNTLIYNFNFSNLIEGIHIRTPKTVIIGTDEFDQFMVNNKLYELVHEEKDYKLIQKYFLKAKLTPGLEKKLKTFLKLIWKPIAVRSSSLLEDSINQPFSGIFNTFLLPNNNANFNTRFRQTANAIKMVYASIYSDDARSYFEAVNFKVEDEQMAIVLQEVVGQQHSKYFYPHISGTAQSHNFYPYAHMKPEEGFALAALGLGHYVVEGDKSFRFSPTYPQLEINTSKYLFKNSQTWFYAIDLAREKLDLRKGDLAGLIKLDVLESEKHKTLNHLASVYLQENDRMEPGLEKAGPRILNFSNILKYNYIPLAQTISVLLDVVKEAFGSPVEIEYAVDLNKDDDGKASFYLLQVKPLLGAEADYKIDLKTIDRKKIILYAKKSMGNGKIQDINDIIYVKPDKFDRTKTEQMAKEIEELNNIMVRDKTKYVLMGPGRWGTRDKFIGIPVNWPQISNAKVIVEMSLKDFPLDASLGSHFFHNVTSMNVGYFSVNHTSKNDFIMWDILEKQEVVRETEYFKHVCFCPGLEILMDGKKRTSLIRFKE